MKLWFMTERREAWSSGEPGAGGGPATTTRCEPLSATVYQGEGRRLAPVGPTTY